ncbi:hypothetical protein BH20BAC1_BH20BAC1_23850 [soil metagenome]
MIKYSDLKKGDYVLAETDGQAWQGEVTGFNFDEKQVSVYNGVQDFWFEENALYPLPLDEDQLMKLKFRKEVHDDGSVKYMKGAFRIQTPSKGEFSNFELWYRDEKRVMLHPIYVHQLQNHHLTMTKVHLTDEVM